MEQREREAGCPACAGCQRLLLEGEDDRCEVCGEPVAAVVLREVVVETHEDVSRARAAAAAAGIEVLGPLPWGHDDQDGGRQVIEVVEGGPAPDAGGK
jgi:hypothetical protein